MHTSEFPKSSDVDDAYQKQKLYIEELVIDKSVEDYEKELKLFLSRYGTIIDIKILQNRELSRAPQALRVCDLQGRRERRVTARDGA